jgi:hypothetical protein
MLILCSFMRCRDDCSGKQAGEQASLTHAAIVARVSILNRASDGAKL